MNVQARFRGLLLPLLLPDAMGCEPARNLRVTTPHLQEWTLALARFATTAGRRVVVVEGAVPRGTARG